MRSEEQIMKRLKEHKEQIEDLGFEVVGTFLYGSQNYEMETENSDIDSKVIVVPSFEDFLEENENYEAAKELSFILNSDE